MNNNDFYLVILSIFKPENLKTVVGRVLNREFSGEALRGLLRFTSENTDVEQVWLSGRIPPGWRPLHPGGQEQATFIKATTDGTQDNRFLPLRS